MEAIGWILWRGTKAGSRRSLLPLTPNDLGHALADMRPKKKRSNAAEAAMAHLDYGGE